MEFLILILKIIGFIILSFFTFVLLFFLIVFVISGTIIDMIKYPFDKNKEKNKFHIFLQFLFIEYPAYFWEKPNIRRILVLPILIIYILFKKK